MICFLAGPFFRGALGKSLFISWLVGAVLVFAGLAYMGMYGESALKDGELIFTYATLILAPPASFVLPLFSRTTSGFGFMAVVPSSLMGWGVCVLFGMLQWGFVCWSVSRIRHRFK